MKIISQSNKNEAAKDRLLDIVQLCFSELKIDDPLDRSASLEETVDAVEDLLLVMMSELDTLSNECTVLAMENVGLNIKAKISDMIIEKLSTVNFDTDLDVVVQNFMESMVASGSAEPTFDGEISFSDEIVFSKDDLKPYLQDAIQSWILARLK